MEFTSMTPEQLQETLGQGARIHHSIHRSSTAASRWPHRSPFTMSCMGVWNTRRAPTLRQPVRAGWPDRAVRRHAPSWADSRKAR
jgi:hypothetical protein